MGEAWLVIRAKTDGFKADLEAQTAPALAGLEAESALSGDAAGGLLGGGLVKGAKGAEGELETAGEEGGGKLAAGVSSGLSKLSGLLGGVFPPIQGLRGEFDKLAGKVESSGSRSSGALGKFQSAAGSVFAFVGAAAIVVGGVSIDMAEKFQTATSSIAANAGISQSAANKIGAAFLSTAGTTEFSATEMSTAFAGVVGQLDQLNKHVLTPAQSLAFMAVAMDLATGSGTNLNSATKDLGNVMQIYGIGIKGAAGASDILFNSARVTGMSVDSVSGAFSKLHGALGVATPSLGDVGTLLVDLKSHGEDGRKAIGAVSTAMTGLLTPSKSVTDAQKLMGVSFTDGNGKFIGMKGAIGELQPKLEGMTQSQQLATLKAIGFGGANKALLDTIMAGPAGYDAAGSSVEKMGSAHAAAAIKAGTLPVQMKILKATGEDLAINIGQRLIPIVEEMGRVILGVVKFFEQHKAAAIALGIIIGGVLLAAMTLFTISLFTAGGALEFLIGPIGLVIAAVALIGVAIYELVTHWSTVWGEVKRIAEDVWKFLTHVWGSVFSDIKKIWGDIESFFVKFWPYILGVLMGPVGLLVAFLVTHWHTVLADVKKVWGDVESFFAGIPEKIMGALSSFASMILKWITAALSAVVSYIEKVWGDEITFWSGLPGKILDAVSDFGSMILSWMTAAWNAVVAFVTSSFTTAVTFWGALPGKILDAVSTFGAMILSWMTKAWTDVVSFVTAEFTKAVAFWGALPGQILKAVDGFGALILTWITKAWNAVVAFVASGFEKEVAFFGTLPGKILGALGDGAALLIKWGGDLIRGLWNGVVAAWGAIGNVAGIIEGWVTGALGGAGGWLRQVGANIIQGLINGIGSMAGAVRSTVSSMVHSVVSAVTNPLGIFSPSTVFHGFGENLMQGLANGITANAHLPTDALSKLTMSVAAPQLSVPNGNVSMGLGSGSYRPNSHNSGQHGGVTVMLHPGAVVINARGATSLAAQTAITDGLTGMAKAIVVGIAPTRVSV